MSGSGLSETDAAAGRCRAAWELGMHWAALTIMAELADVRQRSMRLGVLGLMERNEAMRGFLTQTDYEVRLDLAVHMSRECRRLIGWDPRFAKPSAEQIAAALSFNRKETLRDRPVAPAELEQGDWAGLHARVKQGELTSEHAEAIRKIWTNKQIPTC